jgi:hypothetical protein
MKSNTQVKLRRLIERLIREETSKISFFAEGKLLKRIQAIFKQAGIQFKLNPTSSGGDTQIIVANLDLKSAKEYDEKFRQMDNEYSDYKSYGGMSTEV